MASCVNCKESDSANEPLAICDICKSSLCQNCSKLSPTEMRAVMLKRRIISYICTNCQSSGKALSNIKCGSSVPVDLGALKSDLSAALQKDLASAMDSLLTRLSDDLSHRLDSISAAVTDLRDSNVDLVKLLTGPSHQPTLPHTPSLLTLPDASSLLDLNQPKQASTSNITTRKSLSITNSGAKTQPSPVSGGGKTQNVHKQPVPVKGLVTNTSRSSTNGRTRMLAGSRKDCTSKISGIIVPKKGSIFVSRLAVTVSEDDLSDYLTSAFGPAEKFFIEKQVVRSGDYNSFRVEARADLVEKLLDPEVWPVNVMVGKFRFYRPRK